MPVAFAGNNVTFSRPCVSGLWVRGFQRVLDRHRCPLTGGRHPSAPGSDPAQGLSCAFWRLRSATALCRLRRAPVGGGVGRPGCSSPKPVAWAARAGDHGGASGRDGGTSGCDVSRRPSACGSERQPGTPAGSAAVGARVALFASYYYGLRCGGRGQRGAGGLPRPPARRAVPSHSRLLLWGTNNTLRVETASRYP